MIVWKQKQEEGCQIQKQFSTHKKNHIQILTVLRASIVWNGAVVAIVSVPLLEFIMYFILYWTKKEKQISLEFHQLKS